VLGTICSPFLSLAGWAATGEQLTSLLESGPNEKRCRYRLLRQLPPPWIYHSMIYGIPISFLIASLLVSGIILVGACNSLFGTVYRLLDLLASSQGVNPASIPLATITEMTTLGSEVGMYGATLNRAGRECLITAVIFATVSVAIWIPVTGSFLWELRGLARHDDESIFAATEPQPTLSPWTAAFEMQQRDTVRLRHQYRLAAIQATLFVTFATCLLSAGYLGIHATNNGQSIDSSPCGQVTFWSNACIGLPIAITMLARTLVRPSTMSPESSHVPKQPPPSSPKPIFVQPPPAASKGAEAGSEPKRTSEESPYSSVGGVV